MSSPFAWLHYERALPLLGGIDVAKAVEVFSEATKIDAELRASGAPRTAASFLALVPPGFAEKVMALIQGVDLIAVRKLALIASSSVEELEEFALAPAKEQEAMGRIGRMSPAQVIAHVLFFMGMRPNAAGSVPVSSPQTETTNPETDTPRNTASSAAP